MMSSARLLVSTTTHYSRLNQRVALKMGNLSWVMP
jgi:hypothetical protein